MNATKNYSTDGGNTLVIGGKLQVEAGAEVTGILPKLTKADDLAADATAATIVTAYNALIADLKAKGYMSSV